MGELDNLKASLGYSDLQMTPAILELVLMHLARCEDVFMTGYTSIDDSFFSYEELIYQVTWATIKEHHDTYGILPSYQTVSTIVLSRLSTSPMILPGQVEDADHLLSWMYGEDNPESSLDPAVAVSLLQMLLLDRRVKGPMQQAVMSLNVSPDRLPSLVESLTQRTSDIMSLTGIPDSDPFPTNWEQHFRPTIRTGVPVLDHYMHGASGSQEAHVILAPTGVGKTLLGCQIAVSMAAIESAKERNNKGRGKLQVIVSYELGLRDMQTIVVSNAAKIDRNRLAVMKNPKELSTEHNLELYEKELFAADISRGVRVPGEQQRLQEAKESLNDFLRIADFSGARMANGKRYGNGGIAEIGSVLERYRVETEREIGVVIIDWAGLCLSRYLASKNIDSSRMTAELSQFISLVHSDICCRFDCVAWVTHQLAGTVTGKSPTYPVSHADAMQCKTFAISAWHVFCLGNKDKDTNTCVLWNTKGRNSASRPETICKIMGAISTIVPAEEYTIDSHTGKIVPRRAVEAFLQEQQLIESQELIYNGIGL